MTSETAGELPEKELPAHHAWTEAVQRTALLNQQLFQQIAAANKTQMAAATEVGSAMREAQRRLDEAMAPAREMAARIGAQVAQVQADMQHQMDLVAAWQKSWAPFIREAAKSFKQLPLRIREGLVALAHAGWYFDHEMPFAAIGKLRDELAQMPVEDVNAGLARYFRRELGRIEDDLVRRHPHRAKLIASAFAAHRGGNYDASIPLLFAQVDGICDDIAESHLFSKGLSKYASSTKLEDFERAYMEPLLQQIPVKYGEGKRGSGFTDLNRHAVMHGESLDYGSEENGLKAVSLLNYVSYVLSEEPEAERTNSRE